MKTKILKLAFLALALSSLSYNANAQLAGTQRVTENQWIAGDRKIQFGSYPNAEIYYNGTNLVIDVTHGGGKVVFPDGLDLGSSNQTLGQSLIFEGATNDAFETTLTVTDPTADRTITLPNASGTVLFTDGAMSGGTINNSVIGGTTPAAATVTALSASGNVTFTAATNIGWSVRTGANTACNTTCTNACVFGEDTGTNAIVDCADATADRCVCAGAN